jgi:hypothetical protein
MSMKTDHKMWGRILMIVAWVYHDVLHFEKLPPLLAVITIKEAFRAIIQTDLFCVSLFYEAS